MKGGLLPCNCFFPVKVAIQQQDLATRPAAQAAVSLS